MAACRVLACWQACAKGAGRNMGMLSGSGSGGASPYALPRTSCGEGGRGLAAAARLGKQAGCHLVFPATQKPKWRQVVQGLGRAAAWRAIASKLAAAALSTLRSDSSPLQAAALACIPLGARARATPSPPCSQSRFPGPAPPGGWARNAPLESTWRNCHGSCTGAMHGRQNQGACHWVAARCLAGTLPDAGGSRQPEPRAWRQRWRHIISWCQHRL